MFSENERYIDDYEVVEKIGEGGQSVVYKAWHPMMKRYVALKVLRTLAPLATDDEKRRFRIEIEVSAMLTHANILRAYDAREYRGVPYLVMELRNGRTLSEIVREFGNLSPNDAVQYTRQAAFGLAFAHERGVIHRDVKPANL